MERTTRAHDAGLLLEKVIRNKPRSTIGEISTIFLQGDWRPVPDNKKSIETKDSFESTVAGAIFKLFAKDATGAWNAPRMIVKGETFDLKPICCSVLRLFQYYKCESKDIENDLRSIADWLDGEDTASKRLRTMFNELYTTIVSKTKSDS